MSVSACLTEQRDATARVCSHNTCGMDRVCMRGINGIWYNIPKLRLVLTGSSKKTNKTSPTTYRNKQNPRVTHATLQLPLASHRYTSAF